MVSAVHLVGLEVVSHLEKDVSHLDVNTSGLLDALFEQPEKLLVETHDHLDVGEDLEEDRLGGCLFQSQRQDENLDHRLEILDVIFLSLIDLFEAVLTELLTRLLGGHGAAEMTSLRRCGEGVREDPRPF